MRSLQTGFQHLHATHVNYLFIDRVDQFHRRTKNRTQQKQKQISTMIAGCSSDFVMRRAPSDGITIFRIFNYSRLHMNRTHLHSKATVIVILAERQKLLVVREYIAAARVANAMVRSFRLNWFIKLDFSVSSAQPGKWNTRYNYLFIVVTTD